MHSFNTKVYWKFWESGPEVKLPKLRNPLIQPNLEIEFVLVLPTNTEIFLRIVHGECVAGHLYSQIVKFMVLGVSHSAPALVKVKLDESTWPILNSSMPNFTVWRWAPQCNGCPKLTQSNLNTGVWRARHFAGNQTDNYTSSVLVEPSLMMSIIPLMKEQTNHEKKLAFPSALCALPQASMTNGSLTAIHAMSSTPLAFNSSAFST